MKTEDFERLKAVCEKEGFVVDCKYPDSGLVFVKKRDPWEGVEFVKILSGPRIWKITGMDASKIFVQDPVQGAFIAFSDAVPSTEQAYVEQLKKEAFERFGDIKDGDEFKFNNIKQKCLIGFKDFVYYKHIDRVLAFGAIIYEKGKWAERVQERVYVTHELKNYFCDSLIIKFSTGYVENPNDIAKFLSSQLEKYLNNEIE